jgi:4-hydroxy-3-methylbut-2-en-1-yl diphosphate synthase IspG/GcpE
MKTLVATVLFASLGIGLAGCIVQAPGGVAPAPVGITIGWHGEQYYDGHRYWAHDDWMRNHPNDRDPHNEHDDHHDGDH